MSLEIFNAAENVSFSIKQDKEQRKNENTEQKKQSGISQISLKLESDLLETIKKAAKAEGRIILSEYIRVLLLAGLEAKGIDI